MDLPGIIISIVILVFSAILHEIAHGFVADKLGDPTPRLAKRLTLNPLPHIDWFMSIVLPLLLIITKSPVIFGGAKPVPIDPFNLKEGRKDVALVSLAGPLTNILIAIIGSLFMHILILFHHTPVIIFTILFFKTVISINLFLAIFNLLPIPPLDGSKVFALLLPKREAALYVGLGQFGMIIVFFLLAFPFGGFSLQEFMYTIYSFAASLLGLS